MERIAPPSGYHTPQYDWGMMAMSNDRCAIRAFFERVVDQPNLVLSMLHNPIILEEAVTWEPLIRAWESADKNSLRNLVIFPMTPLMAKCFWDIAGKSPQHHREWLVEQWTGIGHPLQYITHPDAHPHEWVSMEKSMESTDFWKSLHDISERRVGVLWRAKQPTLWLDHWQSPWVGNTVVPDSVMDIILAWCFQHRDDLMDEAGAVLTGSPSMRDQIIGEHILGTLSAKSFQVIDRRQK